MIFKDQVAVWPPYVFCFAFFTLQKRGRGEKKSVSHQCCVSKAVRWTWTEFKGGGDIRAVKTAIWICGNSEKKRLEEDNGLISQKLTVRPAWTVNNLIITDLMPLGLTEIEKATHGWGAVNQVCSPRRIISTPVHAKATSDDRYKFKWHLKGTLRRTHIWLTSPTKWFKSVTLNVPRSLLSPPRSASGFFSSGGIQRSLTLCACLMQRQPADPNVCSLSQWERDNKKKQNKNAGGSLIVFFYFSSCGSERHDKVNTQSLTVWRKEPPSDCHLITRKCFCGIQQNNRAGGPKKPEC